MLFFAKFFCNFLNPNFFVTLLHLRGVLAFFSINFFFIRITFFNLKKHKAKSAEQLSARLVYPNSNLFIELAQQQQHQQQQQTLSQQKKSQPSYLPPTTPNSGTTFITTTSTTKSSSNNNIPSNDQHKLSLLSPTSTNSALNTANKSNLIASNSPKTSTTSEQIANRPNGVTKDYTNDLFSKFEKATFLNQSQNQTQSSRSNNNNSSREMNNSSINSVGNAVTEAR
jgi:hypothetical protein